jgi:3-oxoacyl-ACP reductase-like protein
MLTQDQINDRLRAAAYEPSARTSILTDLLCNELSEIRAKLIRAVMRAEAAQTCDDYDAWGIAAETIATLATAEMTAFECAVFDADATAFDRQYDPTEDAA